MRAYTAPGTEGPQGRVAGKDGQLYSSEFFRAELISKGSDWNPC